MKDNPFNLTFGKEPTKMISRFAQTNEILDIFSSDRPSQQVYMITGVRGSGKTVFMNSIGKSLSREDDWIVLELNSSADLLRELAAKLYNTKYIDEYVYDKIWIELSEKETVFLEEIAVNEITDVKSLKESLALKPNEFSVYRDRLIKKGILESPRRGYLEFALPYLDDYIRERSI